MDILLIEDDPETARILREQLGEAGHAIVHAASAADGLARAGEGPFDIIILDRMLPDGTGLEVARRLRSKGCSWPILMLSALGRSEERVEGLDGGADDYLAKPYDRQELLARISALARRSAQQENGAIVTFGDIECHVRARTVFRRGVHVPLSPREYELLKFFIDHGGDVVTREMLLAAVWKLHFDPQTNVVDVSIGRLRRKLEAAHPEPVLETIWGTGYRLRACQPG